MFLRLPARGLAFEVDSSSNLLVPQTVGVGFQTKFSLIPFDKNPVTIQDKSCDFFGVRCSNFPSFEQLKANDWIVGAVENDAD